MVTSLLTRFSDMENYLHAEQRARHALEKRSDALELELETQRRSYGDLVSRGPSHAPRIALSAPFCARFILR